MTRNTPIEYLRVLVSAVWPIESALCYLSKLTTSIFLIYLFSTIPCNYENSIIRLYQRFSAITKFCNGIEFQRLHGIYAVYLPVACMLYKHIVAAIVCICKINIRYISAVLHLYLFNASLEVIYKASRLIKTDKLPESASDNALKLRSVKHLRNNTVAAPLHSLADDSLNIKRPSVCVDDYQQRRRFGFLHKPRYVYTGYPDRAYAFDVCVAA